MNTSDVLNRAADLIEERGWTGNGSGWSDPGESGPLCLEGGIAAALGVQFSRAWSCPAFKAVEAYLSDRTDLRPFQWNDRQYHDRVLLAIRAHDFSTGMFDMDAARVQAQEGGAVEVIATLRAAAVIEAAKETADEPAREQVSA